MLWNFILLPNIIKIVKPDKKAQSDIKDFWTEWNEKSQERKSLEYKQEYSILAISKWIGGEVMTKTISISSKELIIVNSIIGANYGSKTV